MSRQGPAARTVAHNGPLRWDAPHHGWTSTARVSGWGPSVSFNPGFSAAC